MSSYIESLKHLLAAKDHRVALIDHFSYLADTPGTEALLEDLFQQAQKVLIDRCEEWQISTLVIQFENGRELIAQEGLIIDALCGESWPGRL
ncbi:hypothetical protein FH581_014700 [Leptospira weilii]|nr:hypothetical protein [Leptospira weilii]ULH27799.1 hypothetical protein FH586_15580 [Leptospira weilii]UPY77176.1 hypothetical protein FH581_014700 [Leptospira weilii]